MCISPFVFDRHRPDISVLANLTEMLALCLWISQRDMTASIVNLINAKLAELLSITLDKNLDFKSHIENICCKANNRIKAPFQIRSFLTLEQAKVLAEAYILSNLRYCSLVWMFSGKYSNNLIMKTHYRCLWAIYNTQTKTYHDLLHINGKNDIHTLNIQILMAGIYSCLNNNMSILYKGLL